MRRLALLAVHCLCFMASAETVTGKVYKKGAGRANPLFIQEIHKEKRAAGEVHRTVIRAAAENGDLAYADEMYIESGKFKKYIINHHQLKERWTVELKNGKTYYTKEDLVSGKSKERSEAPPESFTVGPMIVPFLIESWPALEQGKTLKIRLGVLQRLETIGFQFVKEGETTFESKKVVKILMKPTSFIISALVDPIEFYFTAEDRRLVYTVGRTQLRYLENGKWKDLTAETVFTPP